MGFKLSRRTEPNKHRGDWTGFIEEGVRLEGKLQLPGTFRINCQVKGIIVSEQSLILGEEARVEGQIEGDYICVAGKFDGVILAKGRVEIHSKGRVTGEVHTPCLVIEAGGIFDGQCHMLSGTAAKTVTIPIRSGAQS